MIVTLDVPENEVARNDKLDLAIESSSDFSQSEAALVSVVPYVYLPETEIAPFKEKNAPLLFMRQLFSDRHHHVPLQRQVDELIKRKAYNTVGVIFSKTDYAPTAQQVKALFDAGLDPNHHHEGNDPLDALRVFLTVSKYKLHRTLIDQLIDNGRADVAIAGQDLNELGIGHLKLGSTYWGTARGRALALYFTLGGSDEPYIVCKVNMSPPIALKPNESTRKLASQLYGKPIKFPRIQKILSIDYRRANGYVARARRQATAKLKTSRSRALSK
jgi:hypothetical protein